MAATYTLIASNVVTGSTTASVSFTSIPSTYTDLVLRTSTRNATDTTGTWLIVNFNSTSSGYTSTEVAGDGGAASSRRNYISTAYSYLYTNAGADTTANTFGVAELYIPSYTASQNKPMSSTSLPETNGTSVTRLGAQAHLWSNTAAINRIDITIPYQYLSAGSSFYLYGISKS